ncbi:MAG: hypothetical protein JWN01_145 [Patescibacteria group bacterium]|nr:hypothetical protein [Patescibacteria group bacterium]
MEIGLIILAGAVVLLTLIVVAQNLQLQKALRKQHEYEAKPTSVHVSEPTVAQLETSLKAAYEAKIEEATGTFGTDLQTTSERLSEQVSRLTTTVIEEELEAYQQTLEEVRHVATQAMEQIHQAVEHQRVELRQGMEAELVEEKKQLAAKFDAKLGDVVSSYISESLGSGVDLGAQMQFILQSLEKHKDEIRKDLIGDL